LKGRYLERYIWQAARKQSSKRDREAEKQKRQRSKRDREAEKQERQRSKRDREAEKQRSKRDREAGETCVLMPCQRLELDLEQVRDVGVWAQHVQGQLTPPPKKASMCHSLWHL